MHSGGAFRPPGLQFCTVRRVHVMWHEWRCMPLFVQLLRVNSAQYARGGYRYRDRKEPNQEVLHVGAAESSHPAGVHQVLFL